VQAEEEEKRKRRQEMISLNFGGKTPGTAGSKSRRESMRESDAEANESQTQKRVTSTHSGRTGIGRVGSGESSVFDDILAVNPQDDDPFGPREGMYDLQRLSDKTLTQAVEYLDTLRTKTKWDNLEGEEDRKIEHKIVVLVDLRADGTDVHVSPKKTSAQSPSIKRTGIGKTLAVPLRARYFAKCM
jgi:hypothetical protein